MTDVTAVDARSCSRWPRRIPCHRRACSPAVPIVGLVAVLDLVGSEVDRQYRRWCKRSWRSPAILQCLAAGRCRPYPGAVRRRSRRRSSPFARRSLTFSALQAPERVCALAAASVRLYQFCHCRCSSRLHDEAERCRKPANVDASVASIVVAGTSPDFIRVRAF